MWVERSTIRGRTNGVFAPGRSLEYYMKYLDDIKKYSPMQKNPHDIIYLSSKRGSLIPSSALTELANVVHW